MIPIQRLKGLAPIKKLVNRAEAKDIDELFCSLSQEGILLLIHPWDEPWESFAGLVREDLQFKS
jgi:hypothetical protein